MRLRLSSLVAAVVLVGAASCAGGDDNVDALESRLADGGDPPRYQFDYRAAGANLLDCSLGAPHRFTGKVDLTSGVMTLDVPGADETPAVVVTDAAAFLHRSLFQPMARSSPWLTLEGDVAPAAEGRLREALGPDIGGYLLPGGYAPSGNATIESALDVADSVEPLGSDEIDGVSTDRFRLRVDPDSSAALTPSTTSASSTSVNPADDVAPVIEFWIDGDGLIGRLSVAPTAEETDTDGGFVGWVIDYAYDQAALDAPDIPAADRIPIDDVDLAGLQAAPPGPCELGTGDRTSTSPKPQGAARSVAPVTVVGILAKP